MPSRPIQTGSTPAAGTHPPAYFQDVHFICQDCATPQTRAAEDQRWYYESTGAPCYKTAIRCRACRQKEQDRKAAARKSAGHAKP